MNAVSPICLVDLAPALRWSRSPDVAPLLHHDRLIDGWWHSLPVARVLDIAGPPWLAHGIARLAVEQWGHVPLSEFLPSLRTQQVSCADLSEPVRGAVTAAAGDWDRLISTAPQEIGEWPLSGCGVLDVVSTVAWRALQPCCELPGGPTPSPALMLEAVRTIAHWIPDTVPDHVRSALEYLSAATGADGAADASESAGHGSTPPQTPATRAIRTLRALRAQREEREGAEAPFTEEAPVNGHGGAAPTGMVSSAAMLPGPAPGAEAAGSDAGREGAPGDLRSQFRSSLVGPGRTLRRPSFGPPKAMRPDHVEERPPAPALGQHPLVDLVEEMFRSWPDLERTVAAERLFATDPISIRVLSEQIAVDVTEIRGAQRKVEERLLRWLNSPEGAAVTKHMRELSDQLGSATTIDRLINAHPDHPVDVPTLNTPLWRVIITLFTDRRMHNGWLIADDPNRLRWQTRELLGDAPDMTEAGLRLGRIGIRQQELRAWLLSTPGVSLKDGHVFVDASVPMEAPTSHPGHIAPEDSGATTENGLPIRRRVEGPGAPAQPEPVAALPEHRQRTVHDQAGAVFVPTGLEPHRPVLLGHPHGGPGPALQPVLASHAPAARPGASDPAMAARCFRAPDGRWWHRIDITADHLNGAPVAVPNGYATHLGLQPGRLLCLTAPGADLLVLVWRDQPAFDSLRPLLRRQAAQPGDRMFITVAGDRLDARKLPATDLSGYTPAARALHLSGYTAPASTDEALKILSRRITDHDDDALADPQSLIDLLNLRGDNDIAGELRSGLFAAH
ncbi:hypothetical protein ABZ234_23690 [Nocardiopsis sp. NPDC006198]|uniref:Uncharacterized protein n=1 Tax=Streptomonospora nanhaiensis TaxID=1323731 RepID=A0ABY6YSC9_9ACTN|nr:hypothetical protein [Streptomonospora nanhaiensis]WAE75278.1 hypothetical protein OUQ99_09455 [Streptomonospora nanhaiensis]